MEKHNPARAALSRAVNRSLAKLPNGQPTVESETAFRKLGWL